MKLNYHYQKSYHTITKSTKNIEKNWEFFLSLLHQGMANTKQKQNYWIIWIMEKFLVLLDPKETLFTQHYIWSLTINMFKDNSYHFYASWKH